MLQTTSLGFKGDDDYFMFVNILLVHIICVFNFMEFKCKLLASKVFFYCYTSEKTGTCVRLSALLIVLKFENYDLVFFSMKFCF